MIGRAPSEFFFFLASFFSRPCQNRGSVQVNCGGNPRHGPTGSFLLAWHSETFPGHRPQAASGLFGVVTFPAPDRSHVRGAGQAALSNSSWQLGPARTSESSSDGQIWNDWRRPAGREGILCILGIKRILGAGVSVISGAYWLRVGGGERVDVSTLYICNNRRRGVSPAAVSA
jgi:hypothetical protein